MAGGALVDHLIDLAHQVGHTVEYQPLRGHSGLVLPGKKIVINSRKTWATQQATLAHELGHIHYGHDWRLPHDRQRDETQADIYAARLLVTPETYAAAEALHPAAEAIAAELCVPIRYIKLWRSYHARHVMLAHI